MPQPDIIVENLSKRYKLGRAAPRPARPTSWPRRLVHALADHVRRLAALGPRGHDDDFLWALRDANFEIHPSEVVGFIGRNGAGKSTLLKILSRVVTPTSGRALLRGRVGSLLEVGTGFHPELTGRENIYLNGAILGMRRTEIRAAFDEIVAFAEIDRFLDTPVKRYSSGMYVRLAFAVAAHLNPEIMLVDEVLAVGDLQFQQRCLGKMQDVARSGRTVLFVSHNLNAIRSLCTRAILLDHARLVADGRPDDVVDQYLQAVAHETTATGQTAWPPHLAPGHDQVRLRAVRARAATGEIRAHFDVNEPLQIEIDYDVARPLRGLRVVLKLVTADGAVAFASTDHSVQRERLDPGTYRSTCQLPARLLNIGNATIQVSAGVPGVSALIPLLDCLQLHFIGSGNHGSSYAEHWPGAVCPHLDWNVQAVTESPVPLHSKECPRAIASA